MPQFVKETTGLEVASAFPSQIRDKTILITGPTIGGIGYDTALSIASQSPRLIILAGRSNEKLAAAAAGIHERYPGATETRNLILDLSSLESVRAAAKEVLDYGVELDVVICNAGIMALPKYHTSKEGFELQFWYFSRAAIL